MYGLNALILDARGSVTGLTGLTGAGREKVAGSGREKLVSDDSAASISGVAEFGKEGLELFGAVARGNASIGRPPLMGDKRSRIGL